MRNHVWDRPQLARTYRSVFRARARLAAAARVADEETELAFHRVWLARDLRAMPTPRRVPVRLPRNAASGVTRSIDRLRAACGINPLPRRN